MLNGFQWPFYHTLGIWVQMAGVTSVLSAFGLGGKYHMRQQLAGTLALLREELKDWKQRNCVRQTYLWLFILSCLCCRTICRGVAVLVSIIKYAAGNSIWKNTYCTREKKSRGRKKKVQKDRNLSESINVMEIKMHGRYLGTDSLKFQFNF